VELYTRNAAYVLGVEDRVGTLEPGKAADFVVLADNPLRVSPETVADIPILATIVGGNNTYARPLRALMTA
jgi:predicted amidohydrolase YtcJ